MRRNLKKWLGSVICLISLFFLGTVASADELPAGLIIGDSDGLFVQENGKYFVDISEMKQGIPYIKEIKILNTLKDSPMKLELTSTTKELKGKLRLDKEIQVKIEKDKTILYQGDLVGDGKFDWSKMPLKLGDIGFGEEMDIKATFFLPGTIKQEAFKESNEAKIIWNFIASKEMKQEKKSKKSIKDSGWRGLLPQTGEEWSGFLYKVCAGLFLIVIILLIIKKRKEEPS